MLSVKEFIPPQRRVLAFKEAIYERVDRLFIYLMFGYFGFGMLLAFFHDSWFTGFVMGGANLLVLFFLYYFQVTASVRRFILSLQMFVFVLQFILQTEGSFYAQFTFFFTMTVLIFYQNPRLLIPYFVAGIFYYGIGVFASYEGNTELQQYFIYKGEFSLQEALPPLLISTSQFAICVFFAHHLNKQTYENAKNAIYLEEQLNIESNLELAKQIAQGNLFEPYTPKPNDMMGHALLEMREKLKAIRKKDEENAWLSTGISQISSILLQSDDINILAEKLLNEIIKYLKLPYGALYVYNESDKEPHLILKAYYAPEHTEKLNQRFSLGEGLLGEAAKRLQIIFLEEVPPQFEFISSGLGKAKPQSILIIPLAAKQQLTGIIELASFRKFTPREIELLEKVSENIALNLISVQANEKTNKLLYEAQLTNVQLQAQEEQLRSNLAQQQQNQEELLRKQKRLEEAEARNKELIEKLQTMMREQQELLTANHREIELQQMRYRKLEIEIEHLKAKFEKKLEVLIGCLYTASIDEKGSILEIFGDSFSAIHYHHDEILRFGSFYPIIHPDDLEKVKKVYTQKSLNYQIKFRVIVPDGTAIIVQENGKFIEDNFGTLQRIAFLQPIKPSTK
ncbi:MAG: GAF domain-containing protein [Cytophagales bacterium]|nr:GAF domain-containing protein [Cytophagales bacterium]MDW8384872.1 GAF domain-containing protein [Flammeovirgaceae bacterium]